MLVLFLPAVRRSPVFEDEELVIAALEEEGWQSIAVRSDLWASQAATFVDNELPTSVPGADVVPLWILINGLRNPSYGLRA